MKRVLILDGDLHFANTLKMYFRKYDFNCDICTDANHVNEFVDQNTYDLVLCSSQVTHKTGMEVIVSLRNVLRSTGTPLVLVTPNNNLSMNEKFQEIKADAIIHKPISFQNLMATIRTLTAARI